MKKVVSVVALCFWLISCASNQERKFEDYLATLPVSHNNETICGFSLSDAFRLSYSTWKDSSEIKYFIEYSQVIDNGIEITNYFNKSDKEYISKVTEECFKEWSPHVNKPCRLVGSRKDANMVILFKFLEDGKGGMLELSDFPPDKSKYIGGEPRKTFIRMDLSDMYTYIRQRDKATHTYRTVLLHAMGHAFGLMHDQGAFAIMNPNNKYKSLQIDDITGMRVLYKNFSTFDFQKNRYVFIDASKPNSLASKNFTFKEMKSKCTYLNYKGGHFLSTYSIAAIQYLRDYYNCPIKILSSYRDVECNSQAGGAKLSSHITINAIDFKFIGVNGEKTQKKFVNDIRLKSVVLRNLLAMNVRAFGTYPYGYGTNHLDSREVIVGNNKYGNTQYLLWGNFILDNERAMKTFDDFTTYD